MKPRRRIAILTNEPYEAQLVSYVLDHRTHSTCSMLPCPGALESVLDSGDVDGLLVLNYSMQPERRGVLVDAVSAAVARTGGGLPIAFWDVSCDWLSPITGADYFSGDTQIADCVAFARSVNDRFKRKPWLQQTSTTSRIPPWIQSRRHA